MFVKVSQRPEGILVSLEEVDDLGRFHVELAGLTSEQAAPALKRAGAVADEGMVRLDDAWIRTDYLIANAVASKDVCPNRLDAMFDYAASKGWMSEDGSQVRAHIQHV